MNFVWGCGHALAFFPCTRLEDQLHPGKGNGSATATTSGQGRPKTLPLIPSTTICLKLHPIVCQSSAKQQVTHHHKGQSIQKYHIRI